MEYVFGSAMICTDMNYGKKLAYDPVVSCNQVTIDGDFLSRSGTISGGKSKNEEKITLLEISQELNYLLDQKRRIEAKLIEIKKKIDAFRSNLKGVETKMDKFR